MAEIGTALTRLMYLAIFASALEMLLPKGKMRAGVLLTAGLVAAETVAVIVATALGWIL